jgi:predicted phosphodiesterase
MLFQYFSDVHTEFYTGNPGKIKRFKIEPKAPYLILAGDIGIPDYVIYREFLEYLSPMFKKIFLITGNHEYYSKGFNLESEYMIKVDNKIREITKEIENVVFLQNELYNIDDTDIFVWGTTLWSDIKKEEEDYIGIGPDYYKIPGFSVGKSRELFQKNKEELERVIKENPEKKIVVITHHLPSYRMIDDRYIGYKGNSQFASELEVVKSDNVVGWVCGHTHTAKIEGKIYCNPIGYPGENKEVDFNKVLSV